MRKFFLGAALVAASFGMAQSADAATVMDVDGVSTVLAISDYEGTYNGTMDQIKMRGEDYEPRTASYTLEGGLFVCLLRKNYHNIFTSPNGEDTIILSARLLCR